MKTLPKITTLTLAITLISSTIAHAQTPQTQTENNPTTTIQKQNSTQNPNRQKRLEKTYGWGYYIYLTTQDQHHLINGGFDDITRRVSNGLASDIQFKGEVVRIGENFLIDNGICPHSQRLEISNRKYKAKCVNF